MKGGLNVLKLKKGAPTGNKNASKSVDELKKNRSFKTSDREWNVIVAKAASEGLTVSAYLRKKAISE